MKLPRDLEGILNWNATEADGMKTTGIDSELEASIDRFINSMYPAFGHLVQFGVDYHKFMDSNDPAGLVEFIEKYRGDSYWRLAKFANGLQMDIAAVKNALLHPNISNGPVEGKNSSVKCDKRVYGGRAKIDLLTAKALLRQKYTGKIAAA